MSRNKNDDSKPERRGFRPLNVGYTPKEAGVDSPKTSTRNLPKAPQGGTGEKAIAAGTTGKR